MRVDTIMSGGLAANLSYRWTALVLIEHVLIVLAVMFAALVPFGLAGAAYGPWDLLPRTVLIACILQVCLHYCDLYDLRTLSDRRELVSGLLRALGVASLILATLYFWKPSLIIGRGVFVFASVIIIVLVAGWRIAFEWLSLRAAPAERLLIVGTSAAALVLARELFARRGELGVELVGFVDPDPEKVGLPMINPGIIGTIDDIPAIVRERKVDRVVVSLADARGKLPMDQLLAMRLNQGVRFDHLPTIYEQYTGKIAVENLRPSWLIFSEGFPSGWWPSTCKRATDIVLASVGLVLALPLMALAAVAVKLSSPGPVFYRQTRVGKEGKPFTICKFRSMYQDAEAATGAVWATAGDPRVTKVGRFLRRTRLDEIPQLLSVVTGDMSLVGPRPERPEFVGELTTQIPFYGQRHVVRPGVTGWAQVRHPYGSTVEDAFEKLQYDLFYIKRMSPGFDLFIILETIKTVLVRAGS
jgi:sugar transferase (PEP-CTERM system associated)